MSNDVENYCIDSLANIDDSDYFMLILFLNSYWSLSYAHNSISATMLKCLTSDPSVDFKVI